jgi:iron complex outermembrane receptor protein
MTRTRQFLSSLITTLAVASLLPLPAMAQSASDDEAIEEVITTGTRSAKPRSASDSPVPVDVINADDLEALGNTADLTDNIRAMVPSYTATPATGDGSANGRR